MGAFYVTIRVGDAKGERLEDVRALADTGAAWTWLPKDILDRLDYNPTLKRRLQTADNRIIERDAGMVTVGIGDETLPTLTIFGDTGSIPAPRRDYHAAVQPRARPGQGEAGPYGRRSGDYTQGRLTSWPAAPARP
jgi:predicted aspartyl protease